VSKQVGHDTIIAETPQLVSIALGVIMIIELIESLNYSWCQQPLLFCTRSQFTSAHFSLAYSLTVREFSISCGSKSVPVRWGLSDGWLRHGTRNLLHTLSPGTSSYSLRRRLRSRRGTRGRHVAYLQCSLLPDLYADIYLKRKLECMGC